MEDTAKKFCSILFDVFQQKGVRDVVCSPGSRNVPLLLAAASRNQLKKHFVVDERSAGFFGLGISLVSKNPVVLICTSGTALLNYAPAVAEAYYQNIPLIVVSADRPIQWIDQDDSQTLRQEGTLGNFVKKSYSIPAIGEEDPEMLWFVNRIANDAMMTALSGRKGPVHINIQLSEPLNKTTSSYKSSTRTINVIEADTIGNKEIIKDLAKKVSESRVMLVTGFNSPDSLLQKAVNEFKKNKNVVVMAETISNLHFLNKDYSVDSVLTAFDSAILDKNAPDLVISLGGALVSRKLKEFLRRNISKCEHWSIGYSHTTSDPFMSLNLRIETEPARFFRNLNSALRKLKPNVLAEKYQNTWDDLREKASKIKYPFIQNCEWSELRAFDIIFKNLPSDFNLFLSNGTPIRYAQIIPYSLPHASYCNRGVSGIDGSISTAIGGGVAYKGKTMIITGDLSMAYDVGALSLQNVSSHFKIIVIDNQGGGIFRFIPSTASLEIREEYLCQSPLLPLAQLAEGYGWDYFECADEKALENALPKFLHNSNKSIMRIICPPQVSADILKNYMSLKN